MRVVWSLFLTGLAASLAGPATAALTYYVSSSASATTSGNILNGQSASQSTGQVQVLSNSAGPFSVGSSGQFYNFGAQSWVQTEIGAVHAYAVATATSTGPAGGANASGQGQWSDTITITSATLAAGTPVDFLATVVLHRAISGTNRPGASASAEVNGPFGLNLRDTLASPNPVQSVSAIVHTTIGQVLSATSTLTASAGASGIAPFDLSGSVLAQNTATFHFDPITAGASYSTASGASFVTPAAAPEPGSLTLLCIAGAGAGLGAWRRKRRAGTA